MIIGFLNAFLCSFKFFLRDFFFIKMQNKEVICEHLFVKLLKDYQNNLHFILDHFLRLIKRQIMSDKLDLTL